ncbi:MAG: YajQ family cyclic di-GMP-binding protein [Candidatus Binatia bacterium]
MASFDIVNRVDLQEIDNAVNITKRAILTRYDFRQSKTEITLDKKAKAIRVVTEDEMKMRAVQDGLLGNLVKRKVDVKCLDPKEITMVSRGMIQREFFLKEGVDAETARKIVKLIKDKKIKVQAAIQDRQIRVTGKKIDDLQSIMQMMRSADLEVPLQFVNLMR